ncbi:hypothetical protein I4U23_022489 [Adineta vaga]|nr:hypothetical protein I4U23_022489 [Adineta vaga]
MSTSINLTSTQTSNTVIILTVLTKQYLVHLALIFIILGILGFIGNALTYLQKEFRSYSCCIYSFCGSIVDVINLVYNLLPNYLSTAYEIYIPWTKLPNLCKFYICLLGFLPHLSINFLLMSIIDRYASTCSLTSRIHRLNHIKMVPSMISITILLSFISLIRPLILYEYHNEKGCVATQPLLNNILYTIINGILQPIIMLIFVVLTFRNVRQSRQRVTGTGALNIQRTRNQFINMILTQILATTLIALQWMIMYIYYFIPIETSRTLEQQSIVNFFYSFTNYCYYLNNVKSFYLSILTSHLFRKTFIKSLIKFLPSHQRQRWTLSQTNVPMMNLTRINPQRIT